jgi:transaldolase/glucose-6-phosphate isomerase
MTKNPLQQLHDVGQSVWLDNIRRSLITSGELDRMIREDALTGITSNPSIFEKAIGGSTDYDEALKKLVASGKKNAGELFEALAVEDIQMACDRLRPVYEQTHGLDGYVSIEVSPHLLHDTAATVAEVHRLHNSVNRPNVLVKIPASEEGLPAIEACLAEGININITLIFSLAFYERVAQAYLSALEKRVAAGKPIDKVASVASFFVSRVDTLVDKQLEEKLKTAKGAEQEKLTSLLGKSAIANAKLAYEKYQEIFHKGERFAKLKARGAMVQRCLWASTSTKNPHYRDVLYVEELIGPETVNTMPNQTIEAFKDHGKVAMTLTQDVAGAQRVLLDLKGLGISYEQVTQQLLDEGGKLFADSFDKLMQVLEEKREKLLSGMNSGLKERLGPFKGAVQEALDSLDRAQFVRRMWARDATLWKQDPADVAAKRTWIGWLDIAEKMTEQLPTFDALRQEMRERGFKYAVLLGMGGSSLAPEVIRRTFGVARGQPDLIVLDSTDPATLLDVERHIDLEKTVFLVASKSGTTTETLSHYKYFHAQVAAKRGKDAGSQFIAITDPGSYLEQLATENHFLHTFRNATDIGGRYSALSYFGLVPAAMIGVDVGTLLQRAGRVLQSAHMAVSIAENWPVRLGAIVGALAKQGHDKVTFVTSPGISTFGYWVEQLIAESTGKEGRGIVPDEGEALGEPSVYGNDRLFVYLRLENGADTEQDLAVEKLERAGQPVVRIGLDDPYDLGGEFLRWEIATAVAGWLIGINPFDQPNVQESKDNTRRLLAEYERAGKLPLPVPLLEEHGVGLSASGSTQQAIEKANAKTLEAALAAFKHLAKPGDYVAILAYIQRTEAHDRLLQQIRLHLRDTLKTAVTVGYGPRFLHSTGQLHKGGGPNGLFLQITADDREDAPIPGEKYSFGTLKAAQALGDLHSLQSRDRRAIRLHLKEVNAGLKTIAKVI